MYDFKDVFISYGRADSKSFAFKLHDQLVEQGKRVWFDQKDIPLGVDFQEQIDDGIEKAHNFIFVIAPHSVKSQYCLKEILLAVKQNKRIIPILHVEPSDCWDKMHPTIAKLNWIYFREEYDDFDKSFEGLIQLLDNHSQYVFQHTYFLNRALEWERNQNQNNFLLKGQERIEAQEWLQTKFETEQPPCEPTELHAQYICEAKKNAESYATDVFLSAVPTDSEYQKVVQNWLNRKALSTWTPESDIQKGVNYDEAVKRGIESATNILFFISPDSVVNPEKQEELNYAKKLNKRIIPLLVKAVPYAERPPEIRALPVIDFTDNQLPDNNDRRERSDLQKDLDDILNEVLIHHDYYHTHKTVLIRALQWEKQSENPGVLLRGWHLQTVWSWLKLAGKDSLMPALPIQAQFIQESLRKRAELETDIYLCYSPHDTDFVQKINNSLESQGKITWFDKEYISQEHLEKESFEGIEQAHIFIYIISPNSVDSESCQAEIDYALSLNKKIIPVSYIPVHQSDMPVGMAGIPIIECTSENNFQTAFGAIVRLIDTDSEYLKSHTKWLKEAMAWEKSERSSDLLLRGSEYSLARAWLEDAQVNHKNPKPTDLQIEYIQAAESAILAAEMAERQRQAHLLKLEQAKVKRTRIFAIFVALLALGSIYLAWRSYDNKIKATNAKIAADSAKTQAIDALGKAKIAKEEAEKQRIEAEKQRDSARIAQREANTQRREAERQRDNAERAEQEARLQKGQAIFQKQQAEEQRDNAEKAKTAAANASNIANLARAEAIVEKNKADKLYMLSQAKILSVKAIQHLQDSVELSANLALHGYFLNQQHGGDDNTENYSALYHTLKNLHQKKDSFKIATDSRYSIRTLSYNPDNQIFVTGREDGKLLIWDEKTTSNIPKITEISLGNYRIRSTDFALNGSHLWVTTTQGGLFLIHLQKPRQKNIPLHQENGIINRVRSFQLNQQEFVVICCQNSLKIFQVTGKTNNPDIQLIQEIQTSAPHIAFDDVAVCTASSDKYLTAGQSDGVMRIWDLNANIPHQFLTNERQLRINKSITAVALSPNGKYFAVGSKEGFVGYGYANQANLFEVKTALLGHTSQITELTFDAQSQRLASACLDQTSRLWNFASKGNANESALIFRESNRWVWGAKFTRKGARLVTVTEGGYIHLWATESRILAEKLCEEMDNRKIWRMSPKALEKYVKREVKYRKPNCLTQY